MPDLARLRESLSEFAAAAGAALTDWQVAALDLATRVSVIVAPRQSGKSRALAVLALWWAYRRPEQRILIVSAGEEASRRLLADVRRLAMASALLRGSVIDERAGLITLSNGSEIRSVPASERQIRGWSVDLLLVDEAALVPDDLLLGAAMPTTAARPDARIVLASSPATAAGAFFDHATAGDRGSEHARTFHWSLTDCRWISPSVIEAARASMTDLRFRCEYEGEFASGADSLFSKWTLDRATVDIAVPGFDGLRGPARVLGGVDWGQTTDRSALTAIARLAVDGPPLFAIAASHAWLSGYHLVGPDGVIEQIARAPIHFDTLTAERNGLGGPCCEALGQEIEARPPVSGGGHRGIELGPPIWSDEESMEEWGRKQEARQRRGEFSTEFRAVYTSGEMKAATYSMLRLLMDRGVLLLPASLESLRRELILLRVDLTPSGNERIEASLGHDDLADSLMLAAGPYQRRDGRWSSRLADLCESAGELPSPVDREDDFDAVAEVEVATGQIVPRVPDLLSVDGPQITRQAQPNMEVQAR